MKKGFLFRWISNSVSLMLVTYFVEGIAVKDLSSLLWASFILGIVNAVIRPVIYLFTLPFTVFTLGLFVLIVNGSMLYLTAWLVKGFEIQSFWAAIVGSILISIFSSIFSYFIGDEGKIDTFHFNNHTEHHSDSDVHYRNDETIIDAEYKVIKKEKDEDK